VTGEKGRVHVRAPLPGHGHSVKNPGQNNSGTGPSSKKMVVRVFARAGSRPTQNRAHAGARSCEPGSGSNNKSTLRRVPRLFLSAIVLVDDSRETGNVHENDVNQNDNG
jgi:hypothetical protein